MQVRIGDAGKMGGKEEGGVEGIFAVRVVFENTGNREVAFGETSQDGGFGGKMVAFMLEDLGCGRWRKL